MNLLIVDDEYYSVDGIYQKILDANLGFANIVKAYSLLQAQECFASAVIDVMVTDIEMPKGTGLELVAWVRENRYDTVCIFLTSFARFDYASTAIRLQGFDYLLKPVEESQLLRCIKRAMERTSQIADEAGHKAEASKWRSARAPLMEQFWRELAEGTLLPERSFLSAELARRNLPTATVDGLYCPLLLRCQRQEGEDAWNRNLFDFAMKNIVAEMLLAHEDSPAIVHLSDPYYLVPLRATGSREEVLAQCQAAADACNRYLPGRFCFFVHATCGIEEIPAQARQLQVFAHNQLGTKSSVNDALAPQKKKSAPSPMPTDHWAELLLAQKTELLRQEAQAYLFSLNSHDSAERSDLIRFYHDFLQITYAVLDKKGASAHQLFDTQMPQNPMENACDSMEHMIAWMDQLLANFLACLEVIGQSSGAVQAVCNYIKEHLAEDLNRDHLAAVVYLSPDYLSHVFREQTGQSLTQYIAEQRVKQAKALLLSSDHSIRDVALMSGFQNVSYFAKQFKRATGKTPQAYRKSP